MKHKKIFEGARSLKINNFVFFFSKIYNIRINKLVEIDSASIKRNPLNDH